MTEIGLYYPHPEIRDESWLRLALLYWSKIGRIVPRGFRPRNTRGIAELVDQGLLLDLEPPDGTDIKVFFTQLLRERYAEFMDRYRLPDEILAHGRVVVDLEMGNGEYPPHMSVPDELSHLGWLHFSRLGGGLTEQLLSAGLAVATNDVNHYPWLGIHPKVASVYQCALADELARRNGMQTITDRSEEHAVLNGWTVQVLAKVLLEEGGDGLHAPDAGSVTEAFALTVLQTIVPAGIERLPLKRLLKVREELLGELLTFREFVNSLSEYLADAAATEDDRVRAAKLEVLVEGQVEPRLRELERAVRRAKLEPVRAVLSLKELAPPAALVAGATLLDAPPAVAATGALAFCLLGSVWESRLRTAELRGASPVGYLLGIRQGLSPGIVSRTAQALFRRQ
ncbi:DUF6236 family protein [Streptomyces ochraceiscleroticus]|uniref:DUF6236 family protein n=1 Tax=Streptomyces ochraceiscleroticus TaxID=47761 RepID=A0ABW1MKU3_9ACTN|nr:DUF6236 family protein [Streptomyces ochraceiscleroticus]